jgi:hypothetical protein
MFMWIGVTLVVAVLLYLMLAIGALWLERVHDRMGIKVISKNTSAQESSRNLAVIGWSHESTSSFALRFTARGRVRKVGHVCP